MWLITSLIMLIMWLSTVVLVSECEDYTSADDVPPILCLLCNLLLVCSDLTGLTSTSESYNVFSERGGLTEDRVHLTEVENEYFCAGDSQSYETHQELVNSDLDSHWALYTLPAAML